MDKYNSNNIITKYWHSHTVTELDRIAEYIQWCGTNCQNEWSYQNHFFSRYIVFYFENDSDRGMFYLTFAN